MNLLFDKIIELIKKYPNDQDLGRELRKLLNNTIHTPNSTDWKTRYN